MTYRTELRNLAIFGQTQQGKSVLANEILSEDRRIGVFFAPDPEEWFTGTLVKTTDQFTKGLQQGRRQFVVPVGLWGNVEERHGQWVRWLLDKCNRIDSLSVTMVHDESQDLHTGAMKQALKRGLKRGFRNVIVTQSPATKRVSLEPLRQCSYYAWVGPIDSFSVEYVGRKGLFDPSKLRRNEDHEYMVVTATGEVVDTGRPNVSKYGP